MHQEVAEVQEAVAQHLICSLNIIILMRQGVVVDGVPQEERDIMEGL